MADYEYRALKLPRGASSRHTREVLGIHAEYGDWELVQHAVWPDGRRAVTADQHRGTGPAPTVSRPRTRDQRVASTTAAP